MFAKALNSQTQTGPLASLPVTARSAAQVLEVLRSQWEDRAEYFFEQRFPNNTWSSVSNTVEFLGQLELPPGAKVICVGAPVDLSDFFAAAYGADVLSVDFNAHIASAHGDLLADLQTIYKDDNSNIGRVRVLVNDFLELFSGEGNCAAALLQPFSTPAAVLLPCILDDPRVETSRVVCIAATALRLLTPGGRILVSSEGRPAPGSKNEPGAIMQQASRAAGIGVEPLGRAEILPFFRAGQIYRRCP